MIPYIVYSHTEYIDVLKIQTDYIENYSNKILLINQTKELDIFKKYKDVIFYDDKLPYMSRLLSLDVLNEEVFLFRHESDIAIKRDDILIEKFAKYLIENNLSRIDLQANTFFIKIGNPNTEKIQIIDDVELVRQKNVNNFIFNVNPAIWKKSMFMYIHDKYNNRTFHQSENGSIQKCCSDLKFYKLWSNEIVYSGHFVCIKPIQNFHITQGSRWFPLNGMNHPNGVNCFHNNQRLIDEYNNIINKYDLRNGKRKF